MAQWLSRKMVAGLAIGLLLAMALPWAVFASGVGVAVVDTTAPANQVTLVPGASGSVTINMTVTGEQAGTATFDIYRDWTLSGGTFTGSNPQTFTVPPRAGGAPATTFSTTGTVSAAAGQAPGSFNLKFGAINITNDNLSGAKLAAGASASYLVKVNAPVDTTSPVIGHELTPADPDGANGWYVSDVTVDWTVTDLESAITSISGCADTTIDEDTAGVTLTCSATSTGGTSSKSVTIMRDATAPQITDEGATTPPDGLSGWYISPVTNGFQAQDNLSGFAGKVSQYTFTQSSGTAEGAAVTISSGTVTDVAGNTAAAIDSAPFQIDLSDPTNVAFVGGPAAGGSYYFGSVPAAPTCTADDAISGLASCAVTGYSAAVGTHTLTATATDNAGRTATETLSYSVLAWTLSGFYQPVDMGGIMNTVKAGSTVPLKFEIFMGTTESTSTADIKSVNASVIACDAMAPADDIEATATGGTSLRYDTTAGQFVYNWQTPKSAAGKCYAVTMTAQDGTSLSAFFKLK